MIPVKLPDYDTPETKALCQEIAKKSNGTCFLLFSRGKDSLCAWLQLKKYFRRIIPIHCASIPGLKHVNTILDYYEDALCDPDKNERILRMVGEEVPLGLVRKMYQRWEDVEALSELETEDFSKLDILEYLRYKMNLPKCWCAVGMSVSDSIDRRIYIKKTGGKNPNNLTFYPCGFWERPEILRAVRECGLKLSDEYRWGNRTLGGVPSMTVGKVLREHYPEDYERYLAIWPLAQAKEIREAFLDRIWAQRKADGIVSSDDDSGEFDDGSDVMPGFGMDEGFGE